jgi:hypothetical protein
MMFLRLTNADVNQERGRFFEKARKKKMGLG